MALLTAKTCLTNFSMTAILKLIVLCSCERWIMKLNIICAERNICMAQEAAMCKMMYLVVHMIRALETGHPSDHYLWWYRCPNIVKMLLEPGRVNASFQMRIEQETENPAQLRKLPLHVKYFTFAMPLPWTIKRLMFPNLILLLEYPQMFLKQINKILELRLLFAHLLAF